MRWLFLLVLSIGLFCIEGIAQIKGFDDSHIESSLTNFSSFYTNLEYYKFNDNEKSFYLLTNGTIEFGNSNYLNIELLAARYMKDETVGYTLGDFNLTYTKNFYSEKFLNPGFQGVSPSVKLILPTGKAHYSGIFGYWILEPAIYYSWLLANEKFFFSNRWKLFLPLVNVQQAAEPPLFIRFEPCFGYENEKIWASLTLDNRIVLNQDKFVLFYRLDGGFKINEKSGLSAFYTKRIHNTVFFNIYMGIGYYHIF